MLKENTGSRVQEFELCKIHREVNDWLINDMKTFDGLIYCILSRPRF